MPPGTYASIPLAVLARTDLTPAAKLAYAAMANHLRNGNTEVWPSVARLRAITALGRTAARAAVAQLTDAGLIAPERAPGRVTRYRFRPLPTPLCQAEPDSPDPAGKRPGRKTTRPESDPHRAGKRPTPGRNPTHTGPESDPETLLTKHSKKHLTKHCSFSEKTGNSNSEKRPQPNPDHRDAENTENPKIDPEAFAEVILRALQAGRGDAGQLAADRATLRRAAEKILAGHAGDIPAALASCLNAARNIGPDAAYTNKVGAWTADFKRRLQRDGHTWKEKP